MMLLIVAAREMAMDPRTALVIGGVVATIVTVYLSRGGME